MVGERPMAELLQHSRNTQRTQQGTGWNPCVFADMGRYRYISKKHDFFLWLPCPYFHRPCVELQISFADFTWVPKSEVSVQNAESNKPAPKHRISCARTPGERMISFSDSLNGLMDSTAHFRNHLEMKSIIAVTVRLHAAYLCTPRAVWFEPCHRIAAFRPISIFLIRLETGFNLRWMNLNECQIVHLSASERRHFLRQHFLQKQPSEQTEQRWTLPDAFASTGTKSSFFWWTGWFVAQSESQLIKTRSKSSDKNIRLQKELWQVLLLKEELEPACPKAT